MRRSVRGTVAATLSVGPVTCLATAAAVTGGMRAGRAGSRDEAANVTRELRKTP